MDAIMTDNVAITNEYQVLSDEMRLKITQLYLDRLGRLLSLGTILKSELNGAEQHHLRSRAVLSAVRTLTLLGEGPAASTLLRNAGPHGE